MIPWGAIAVAAWMASRGANPNGAGSDPSLPGSSLVIVVRWLAALFGFVAVTTATADAHADGTAVLIFFVLMVPWLRPTVMLERVFIPLGMARAAYWWTYLMVPVPTMRETPAGRMFYAARALLRQRERDPRALALLEKARAITHKGQRNGLSVVAEGLAAVARGDVDYGRTLLASGSRLERAVLPSVARKVARTWLVADALAAGRIDRALREADGPGYVWWPLLVADELERRRGQRSWKRDLRRPLLWLLGAPRLATWRALQRMGETTVVLPGETGDALADAMAVHRAVLLASPQSRGYVTALAEACRRWEVALASPSLRARIERRQLALNLPNGADSTLADLESDIVGDLVAWAVTAEGTLRELGDTRLGDRVLFEARSVDLAEIDALVDTFLAQRESTDFPEPLEAWALLARLQGRVETALRRYGPELRNDIAQPIFHAVTNWTCRLYNEEREHALGRAAFLWVRDIADTLPAKDYQLAIKNAKVNWF